MASNRFVAAAVVAVASLAFVRTSGAEEAANCSSTITRSNLVPCVLHVSLSVRAERQGVDAVRGRQLAASTWLPSNPTISLSGSRRTGPGGTPEVFNWLGSLSQEVEIAGQRGARRDAAEAQVSAQMQRVLVARRDVAVEAWAGFFDVIAAEEDLRLTAKVTVSAEGIAVLARARADQGLSAPVEADVAEASTLRFIQARFAGERKLAASRAALATLMGLDATASFSVEGDLVPVPGVEEAAHRLIAQGVTSKPEIQAAEAERRAWESRATLYRRLRIPNPSVSVFVQNDGFNERVFGVGLSLPIPLPGPVGRTYAGEAAEADALSRRASTETDRLQRQLRQEVITSLTMFESRRLEVDAFRPDRLARAESSLRALALEIQAGRVNLRDALLTQQGLVELLQAHLAARRALALASVDLARAGGIALDGGGT